MKNKKVEIAKFVTQPIHKFAIASMRKYGKKVIEDRALADFRDGLKPVQRHLLWTMQTSSPRISSGNKMVKAARVVGENMAKYHPSGDTYPALVNMYWNNMPLVDKQGGWGSLNTRPSDQRYVETSLSKYSEQIFLQSSYLDVTDYIPNYDGELKEPLVLPALLPNILLNGAEGIAVAIMCGIPSFDLEGVVKIVELGLEREVTVKDCCKYLQPRYNASFDCSIVNSPEELKEFYSTGRGRLALEPKYITNNNEMILTKFTPHFTAEKATKDLMKLDAVVNAGDYSGEEEGDKFIITLKSSINMMDRAKEFQNCLRVLREGINLQINVTEKINEINSKFHSWNMPTLINEWIKWRKELEIKRAKNDAVNLQKEIDRINLFILACKNLEKIIPIIKANKPDVDERLAKALNITLEQAAIILQMTLRRLTGLSLQELNKDLEKLKLLLKQANIDIKQPTEAIRKGIAALVKVAQKALLVETNEGKSLK